MKGANLSGSSIYHARDKAIVVTGAAGFIGSCLVRHLNDHSMTNLILVDDFSDEKKRNLEGKKWTHCVDKYKLGDWLKGREGEIFGFFHLGACSDTLETRRDFLMENNYSYSVKLAEFALKHGHRFVYASSAATYGDGKLGFSDDHDFLQNLKPLNLYGLSKHHFDLWAKNENVLDRIVGLKYFNVFGPNENHKGHMASMVFKMFPKVVQEGAVHLYRSSDPEQFADGEQKRDFIYVKDAVRMTLSFLFNTVGGIFNIGCGEAVSWNRIARAIFAALNKKANIQYIEMPQELRKQYQNYTCADMKKYFALFSSDFAYDIETSVKDYLCNYLVCDKRW